MDVGRRQTLAAAERGQLDHERAGDHLAPGAPYQLDRGRRRSAGGEQIVDDEDAAAVAERALVNLQAVAAVLDAQIKAGLDIVSDGEQPRVGFSMYLPLRMEGFGGEAIRPTPRDLDDFPIFMERLRQNRGRRNRIANPPKTIGEVRYTGLLAAKAEYDLFKSALGALRQKPSETFMTAPSPGIIAAAMKNDYYDSEEAYLAAVAAAIQVEYEAIVKSGFLLQLDCPDLALERHLTYNDRPVGQFLVREGYLL